MKRNALVLSLLLSLLSLASARVEFGNTPFDPSEFSDIERVREVCGTSEAASFWCDSEAELSLITTKTMDVFVNERGEIVALFSKQQTGQSLKNYKLDSAQNLIPVDVTYPATAVLVDGDYLSPEGVEAQWRDVSDAVNGEQAPALQGVFTYMLGDIEVSKTVTVSSVRNTIDVELEADRLQTAEAPSLIQLAVPGIARQDSPTLKVGQGDTLIPASLAYSQAVSTPSYISLQTGNRNRGQALILRPDEGGDPLEAFALNPKVIALGATLAPDEGADTTVTVDFYGGQNELVRYYQEGYSDLPGLFRPNILGRLSLGLLIVLEALHDVAGSWGLAIILLTLLFRIMIWPLISMQNRSMLGMQDLQPKLQTLQKKYKNDREKLQKETMKLYQEAGVNPAGGCLPMIIQMPILIMLWRVFMNFEFNEGFLWIPDLGQADPYFILPLLYVGIMVGQSFLMAKGNPQSLRQQLLINVVFVFFIISFPAGVTLYWVISMLVQVLQYYLLRRSQNAPKAAVSASR